MFKFICLLGLVAAAAAASIGNVETTTPKKEIIPVLRFETDKKPDGSFSFSYEGGDHSFREESGVLENVGTDDEALEVSGSYRYIDADGQEIEVHYTAGRNGFVPVGTNIPAEITSLAKAAADLPDNTLEEDTNRRARSKVEAADVKQVKKVEKVKKVEAVKKPERIEKVDKVEKAEKAEKAEKLVTADKVEKVKNVEKETPKEKPAEKQQPKEETVEKEQTNPEAKPEVVEQNKPATEVKKI